MTCRAGGLWGTRTNRFRRGQCDSTTDWDTFGGGVKTRAVDATVPGMFSAASIKVTTDGTAANQGADPRTAPGMALAAGTFCCGSIYLRGAAAGLSYSVFMRVDNTDASATNGAGTTVVSSGSLQLLTPAPLAVAAGKTGDTVRIVVLISGTRAESFWLSNAMIETNQRQVSPYIPTRGGATASRAGGRRWQLEDTRRMMHRYAQVWP